MRVTHVCMYFYPRVTGVTAHVESLAAHQRAAGTDARVVSWGDPADSGERAGVPVTYVRQGDPSGFRRAVAEGEPRIVHSHGIWQHARLADAAARELGVPHVNTMHGTWLFLAESGAYGKLRDRLFYKYLYRRLLWPRLLRRAGACIVLNAPELALVRQWGVPEERVFRIPNAVDPGRFTPGWADAIVDGVSGAAVDIVVPGISEGAGGVAENAAEPVPGTSAGADGAENEAAPPDGRFTVVFAGSVQRQKGIFTLLRAAALLRGRDDVRWLVCGDGPERRLAEVFARREELGGRVEFLGAVPRARMPEMYRAAGVVALPSRNEPFATVYLEGMACGRPCIGLDSGGTPEIIAHGETGFVLPDDPNRAAEALAGHVAELADDPARAAAMGRAARERVAALFSWDAVTRDIGAVYATLA